jgi:hypothetical protein
VVEGAGPIYDVLCAACPLHHALFASLGPWSPSRRFAGEVGCQMALSPAA